MYKCGPWQRATRNQGGNVDKKSDTVDGLLTAPVLHVYLHWLEQVFKRRQSELTTPPYWKKILIANVVWSVLWVKHLGNGIASRDSIPQQTTRSRS